MNWVPIVLIIFKVGVLGTAMFFAIKSHRDGEKEQKREKEARLRDASAPDLRVDG
jgi:hypothetical protein